MFKLGLLLLALFVALASASTQSDCKLYLTNSGSEINVVGGSKGGCYEVDPSLKIESINADKANVHFKFFSNAKCKGNNVYTGATSNTVITVKAFSAGSVQLTCPRKQRN
ncbi:hypothetical protein Unana1_05686 [Umbelopsis nana]